MGAGAAGPAAVDGAGVGVGEGGQVGEGLFSSPDSVHGGIGAAQQGGEVGAGQVGGAGDIEGDARVQGQRVVGEGLLQLNTQGGEVGECGVRRQDGDATT